MPRTQKCPTGQGYPIPVFPSGVGLEEACGQTYPAWHCPPVKLSVGALVAADKAQKKPPSQSPLGARRPASEQKLPGRHGKQSLTDEPPVSSLYVPTGQATWASGLVPFGQKRPFSHGLGEGVPDSQA